MFFFSSFLLKKIVDDFHSELNEISSRTERNYWELIWYAICFRFRIDGIERQPNVEHTEHIIPYATKRPEFFKQKLLLEKFLPSRYDVLLDSLSLVERVSHFTEIHSLEDTGLAWGKKRLHLR